MNAPAPIVASAAADHAVLPRDLFVTETAIKIDRIEAKVIRQEREHEAVRRQVASLVENAEQAARLHALTESLRNARDVKLDDLKRSIADVKSRLDLIQGDRAAHAALDYRSIPAIDARLSNLDEDGAALVSLARIVKWSLALSGAALVLLLLSNVGRLI